MTALASSESPKTVYLIGSSLSATSAGVGNRWCKAEGRKVVQNRLAKFSQMHEVGRPRQPSNRHTFDESAKHFELARAHLLVENT